MLLLLFLLQTLPARAGGVEIYVPEVGEMVLEAFVHEPVLPLIRGKDEAKVGVKGWTEILHRFETLEIATAEEYASMVTKEYMEDYRMGFEAVAEAHKQRKISGKSDADFVNKQMLFAELLIKVKGKEFLLVYLQHPLPPGQQPDDDYGMGMRLFKKEDGRWKDHSVLGEKAWWNLISARKAFVRSLATGRPVIHDAKTNRIVAAP